MPVRTRITMLFSLLVFIIFAFVCIGIYYFSSQSRIDTIKTRLFNRAITTARLLSQQEIFDEELIQRIDSSTTISLKRKTVQAYDSHDKEIYFYSDVPSDTLQITPAILSSARQKGKIYFIVNGREAVAVKYKDQLSSLVVITAAEDYDGKQHLSALLRILILSFLVGNVFILIAGYFFSHGLLMPIRKISEDVAEISAQNLTRRIQTGKTRDEWFGLSATLNQLLDRLQESFELQQRFISNASHELSTPLTSILSQIEVALQRERDAGAYRQVMQSIHQDVQHMNELTQTLLKFAQASGNPAGLEITQLRIDEIILRLPADITKLNAAYSVKIGFRNMPDDENHLLVFGNEALLFTAIKNIVINACKYSPDHIATVELSVVNSHFVVTVEDRGIGIPREEIEKIFQPFCRVEESRHAGGFGLGLSIVDRIIRLHKGFIKVESQPGKGTKFTIRLPSASEV
jgi:two-component system, OmpR family, sensor histidine kinase ArlS